MILYLKIQHERIEAAKYHTVGCGPTIASGSVLTKRCRLADDPRNAGS